MWINPIKFDCHASHSAEFVVALKLSSYQAKAHNYRMCFFATGKIVVNHANGSSQLLCRAPPKSTISLPSIASSSELLADASGGAH
jgi:hypothetical protein